MKENIKKFDLEAAFKALDEIEAPKVKGIRPNVAYITEKVERHPNTDCLLEDYEYDVSSQDELLDAQEERDGEVAKAKLARIEKIVDLDADSPDELQSNYVGKTIIQCPQCMTMFYKDAEDLEASEDDPNTVNVGEVCQHCGYDGGYTLIGKVGKIDADEVDNFETTEADLNFEEPAPEEAPAEEAPAEELPEELPDELPEELPEEETNESLNRSEAAVSEEESENKSENVTLNEEAVKESVNASVEAPSEEESENNSENVTLNEDANLEEGIFDAIGDAVHGKTLDSKYQEYVVVCNDPNNKEVKRQTFTKFGDAAKFAKAWSQNPSNGAGAIYGKDDKKFLRSYRDAKVAADSVKEVAQNISAVNKSDKGLEKVGKKSVEAQQAAQQAEEEKKAAEEAEKKQTLQDAPVTPAPEAAEPAAEPEPAAPATSATPKIKEADALAALEKQYPGNKNNKIVVAMLKKTGLVESLNVSEEAPSENASENTSEETTLNEDVNKDLDKQLKAHNDYIAYLQGQIKQEEEALKRAGDNEEIKAAIQRRLDAYNQDLQDALPEAVKNNGEDLPTPEEANADEQLDETELEKVAEDLDLTENLTEGEQKTLFEGDAGLDAAMDSDEFNKKIDEKDIESFVNKALEDDVNEDINITNNDSPSRVDNRGANEATEITDEVDEGLGLFGIGDVNVNLDASGQNNAVGVGGGEGKNEGLECEGCCDKKDEGLLSGVAGLANGLSQGVKDIPIVGNILASAEGEKPEENKEPLKEADEEPEAEAEKEKAEEEEKVEEEPTPIETTVEEVKDIAAAAGAEVAEATQQEIAAETNNDEVVKELDAEGIKEITDKVVDDKLGEEKPEEGEAEAEEPAEEEAEEEFDFEDFDEALFNEQVSKFLNEVYSNVKGFATTDCQLKEGKLFVEGKIYFNSGKNKVTVFEFLPHKAEGKVILEGLNKDFSADNAFTLTCSLTEAKKLITESFGYKYKINDTLVEGLK